jgi:hypothetical protein
MVDVTHIPKNAWKLHLSMDMDKFLQEFRTDVIPTHKLYFDNVLKDVVQNITRTVRSADYKY